MTHHDPLPSTSRYWPQRPRADVRFSGGPERVITRAEEDKSFVRRPVGFVTRTPELDPAAPAGDTMPVPLPAVGWYREHESPLAPRLCRACHSPVEVTAEGWACWAKDCANAGTFEPVAVARDPWADWDGDQA